VVGINSVAIIGAGPAGSTLAALLASRGVAVTLYDREQFPRDKLCGEFLSYDALPILDRLGVLARIDAHGAPRIDRCRIVGARRTYEFALPHEARGVSRMLLDDLLLREAIARGAKFDIREVTPATVTVGAWGRWGRHDTQLARSFVRDRSHRNFGFKRHYRGSGTNSAIELYSFSRGYLGVNDVEGSITNICGLVHASRLAGHKGRWDAFVEKIRAEEPALERLYARYTPAQEQFLSSEPVIFRARSAVEGGIFMIGDASGVIDPLTGNGMAMAIQSALLLAPLVLRLLESPHRREAIEAEYRARHRRLFAKRIGWSRTVARMLSRPRLLDAALATLRHTELGPFFLRKTRGRADEIERLADAWFC
jgi:flavin-dependent dehydrogenase